MCVCVCVCVCVNNGSGNGLLSDGTIFAWANVH